MTTHEQAKRIFAAMMAKARTDGLTARERARLSKARQLLRRYARPAMNCGPKKNARKPSLTEAVDARLLEMQDLLSSQHTEHTGRLIIDPATRKVTGRHGGAKKGFSELKYSADSPKAIVSAIGRGKGKVYERVRADIARQLSKHYSDRPKRKRGRPSVGPHAKLRPYCAHCQEYHTKGQHRSHGAGAFHQTHLFSFNKPRGSRRGVRIGRIVEIRYEREIGGKPGFYKHVFRAPASVYCMPDGSIEIR